MNLQANSLQKVDGTIVDLDWDELAECATYLAGNSRKRCLLEHLRRRWHYPVFFPELRPFFLENANYFSTPIDLVYTRNIIRPEFGARVTGKLGHTNIGLLTIDDRSSGQVFPITDINFGKRALFAVGRVTQDLRKGSSVGGIYTDYEFAGSFNRIGGLDFNDKWSAVGQVIESASKALSAPYSAGPASWLEFTRNGHSFNLDNTF